jgi:hypothetical protein
MAPSHACVFGRHLVGKLMFAFSCEWFPMLVLAPGIQNHEPTQHIFSTAGTGPRQCFCMEEAGHEHCHLGQHAPGRQYVVNERTGEVCALPEGGFWTLRLDGAGQGVLQHSANGAHTQSWLSDTLDAAVYVHGGKAYVLEKSSGELELYDAYMSKYTTHLWPLPGIVPGGQLFILGWALLRRHSGCRVFVSLPHWYKALGLKDQPHKWYQRWWRSWVTWLGDLGVGPEHLKKPLVTKQAKHEAADQCRFPARFWPHPAVSSLGLLCLLGRWAAASRGRVSKDQAMTNAARTFLAGSVASLPDLCEVKVYTAGPHVSCNNLFVVYGLALSDQQPLAVSYHLVHQGSFGKA